LIKSQGCNPNSDRTGSSALLVTQERAGSRLRVTGFRLAPAGMVFSYAPHKPKHEAGLEEDASLQTIPVGTVGK
jgi:hypothetical protein